MKSTEHHGGALDISPTEIPRARAVPRVRVLPGGLDRRGPPWTSFFLRAKNRGLADVTGDARWAPRTRPTGRRLTKHG